MWTAKLWKNALTFGNHPEDIRWSSVFLLVFLAIISIIANLGDPTKFGPLVAIILISILYALVWGFLVAGLIKNSLKTRQKQQDSTP